MDISVEIAKHDKLHVTISISKKFSKMTMGFEKRNENVFCDRYRRHATFRGLCVFFSRALTLQKKTGRNQDSGENVSMLSGCSG